MLDQTPLQLEKEGIKEREGGERGGGRRLFEGGEYLKQSPPPKGAECSREAINRGRAIIRGHTVYVLNKLGTLRREDGDSRFFSRLRDFSISFTLSKVRVTTVKKEKENFVVDCLRPLKNMKPGIFTL